MRETERFIPVGVAAERLGCSRTTVGRLIDRGELPAYRIARDRRMRLVDVNDLAKIASPQPLAPRPIAAEAPSAA